MACDCFFLHPLQRDGTSQHQRLVEALLPSYVLVDERTLADLLVYARRYAEKLRFYNTENVASGTWVDFIERDVSTLVALVAVTDYKDTKTSFDALLADLKAAPDLAKPAAFAALFPPIVELALQIDRWYDYAVDGLALRTTLGRFIGSVLTDAYRRLLAYAARAQDVGLAVDALPTDPFSAAWELAGVEPDITLFPNGAPATPDDLLEAATRVAATFKTFYEVLVLLVQQAPTYLQETLDDYAEHQPHMALFLAFLLLFKVAQDHLNEITEKHLLFYYREVLQLDYRPEQPDEVHLVFELAKNFFAHQVPAGTTLKAGKDDLGNNLFYTTDEEIVVNRAVLSEADGLKTVFVQKDASGIVENIYAAPVANSADGQGAEVTEEDGKWLTFGGSTMPYATLGFAVASPMLLLAEGTRTVTVIFTFDALPALTPAQREVVEAELQHNVDVYLSGAKAWLPVEVTNVNYLVGSKALMFSLTLGADVEPVVAYNADKLDGGFDTAFPVLKFVLDNEGFSADGFDLHLPEQHDDFDPAITYAAGTHVAFEGAIYRASAATTGDFPDAPGVPWTKLGAIEDYDADHTYSAAHLDYVRYNGEIYRALGVVGEDVPPDTNPGDWQLIARSYPYRYFRDLLLQKLTLDVVVDGVQSLILENDNGALNPAKPFQPFGPLPKVGSSLYIGSPEIFQKRLAGGATPEITLHLFWGDLPAESFDDHYDEYDLASITLSNGYFKVNVEVLRDGAWKSLLTGQALFTPDDTTSPPNSTISFVLQDVLTDRNVDLGTFAAFRRGLERGFLRLQLQNDFFHSQYPTRLAEVARAGGTFPNPPYTPLVTELKLSYHARQEIDYTKLDAFDVADRVEQLFQIYPFGQVEVFPLADGTASGVRVDRRLVPVFDVTVTDEEAGTTTHPDAEGSLYLGIDALKPTQTLAVLFQVAEGSADPEAEPQPVVWSYLSDDAWHDFETTEIIADRTNGLLTSGIIQFATPKAMTAANTAWPAGLHWLKASVAEHTEAVSKLIDVRPQAVKASYDNQGNDPNHLARALPAETIGKLKVRQAAIKSVTQPYASFNGRLVEQEAGFYVRVSERLRHKQRAVTLFDYERLVLEAFPDVYKVKCITHTDACSEYAPGAVKVIVVPDLRNQNAVDPLQPRISLSTLEKIEAYLRRLASDFVALQVKNPTYEQVKVDFKVTFYAGKDQGFYTQQLEQDVIKFLSPWLYEEGEDLAFGGRIHRSWILNFVEERDYVDFVTDFKLFHSTDGVSFAEVEEATASTSSSVLVSAAEHVIGDTNIKACLTSST